MEIEQKNKVKLFPRSDQILHHSKRIVVLVFGFSILGIGLFMVVFPGPAIIVIPIGLTILATEFIWARRILDRVKEKISLRKK
ncbi:MAG: PGPGW domain-containing protein [Nanoarchaeota archaeon]|nr:PGPGW domain-containing protein [Nanoarchaeota archaeon]MBU1644004.1 PGPGW domain-containing protein [Nanoarchaeota archaeon]MBU1976440.1 PGPGW domain-containing protein [Nanoarchaeota archaeon]